MNVFHFKKMTLAQKLVGGFSLVLVLAVIIGLKQDSGDLNGFSKQGGFQ